LAHSGEDPARALEGTTLGEQLLTPTRIYVKPLLELFPAADVHGLAHITGGGITENLPRVLPADVQAEVDLDSWRLPPVFRWLRERGGISDAEMLRTFNCGVGMLICVPADEADRVCQRLEATGERAWIAGQVVAASGPPSVAYAGQLGD
jgi:phosphoribosylformylglycinamidine cyclo-ligase